MKGFLLGVGIVVLFYIIYGHQYDHQEKKAKSAETPAPPAPSITVKAEDGSTSTIVTVDEYKQFLVQRAKGPISKVEWRASNSRVGSVDETGIFRGLAPGLTNIIATSGDIAGQTQVRVVSAPPPEKAAKTTAKSAPTPPKEIKHLVFHEVSLPIKDFLKTKESFMEGRQQLITNAVEKSDISDNCKIVAVKRGYIIYNHTVEGNLILVAYKVEKIPASETQQISQDSIIPQGYSDEAIAEKAKLLWEKQNCKRKK